MNTKLTSWAILTHKDTIRWVLLAFFIISLLGPWVFDLINVPAEYTCSPPNVRLYGDFCGVPLSGFFIFSMIIGGFFSIISSLATGTFAGRARELLIMLLYLLMILPFFTTIPFFWKKETRLLRTFNLVAWTLALIITLIFFFLAIQHSGRGLQLWGIWLYAITVISAITMEMLILKAGIKREIL